MAQTKDLLNNPDSQATIDAYLTALQTQYPTTNIVDVTVPMNTQAEAIADRGGAFAIDPAVYAARFNNKIHALGMNVYWRATDCYFERNDNPQGPNKGLYDMPWLTSKAGGNGGTKRNGNRFTFLGTNINDTFSSTSSRDHGYGLTSAAGNLSSNYITSHESGNSWSIVSGELTGPPGNAWKRTCLFDAPYLHDVTMVAKVKKVGNQQIVVRTTTDSNFPGYGLQMRDTNVLRIEKPGKVNLGETSFTWVEGNYYWLKLQATGTTIRGKAWAYGSSEPGSWNLSFTDSEYNSGYCGFSGESDSGKFDDMTITPGVDTDTWMYRSCNWIRNNINIFATGDVICPFPEAYTHQDLLEEGDYSQFFLDLKHCIDSIGQANGKIFNTGYSAHLWTNAIQNTYAEVFSDAGVVTYDHYGVAKGRGNQGYSFNGAENSGTNTYSLLTSINEGANHRKSFYPEKVAFNKTIRVFIVNKGTGNWTMTIHDSSNNLVQMCDPQNFSSKTTTGTVTILNANLTNNAYNNFIITWDNPYPDVQYHFHLTSTVANGTVRTNPSAGNLEDVACNGYKSYAEADAYEIDIRKTYAITGLPQFIGEFGDHWSTNPGETFPILNQTEHEAYLETITAALQRLINDGVLIGFCYWRYLGGREGIAYDAGGDNYQLNYAGQVWKTFFDANNPGGGTTTLFINKNESLSITESVSRSNPQLGSISKSDVLSVTEQAIVAFGLAFGNMSIVDTLTVTENVTVVSAGVFAINVSDTLAITESVSAIFRASVGSYGGVVGTSITVSTQADVSKLIALVGVHQGAVTGVTLNGTALTLAATAATEYDETAEIWYIDSPGSLTNVALAATFSGGSGQTIGYINLYEAASGAPALTASANGNSSSASVVITPVNNNSIVIASMYSEADPTIGAGETEIFNLQNNAYENAAASYNIQTTAFAETMDWSLNSGQRWAVSAVAINLSTSAATLLITVNDILSVTESVSIYQLFRNIDLFESVSITESVAVVAEQGDTIGVFKIDVLLITENITVSAPSFGGTNIYDPVNITENIVMAYAQSHAIDVVDTLSVAENTVSPLSLFEINSNEVLTITEDLTQALNFNISIVDVLAVTENTSSLIPFFNIDISESISIIEDISLLVSNISPSLTIVVNTVLTISESITLENFRFSTNMAVPVGSCRIFSTRGR